MSTSIQPNGTASTATATAATGTSTLGTAAAQSRQKLAGDMGVFLTLLTTQLKAQDPTAPLDANQLTQQLVQFATVEQQISQNQTLTQLLQLQQTAQLTDSAPLLGRQVEVESDRLALQDGKAEIMLPAAAGTTRSAVVTIADSAGRTLRQENVTLGSAPLRWNWAGQNGGATRSPDGAYRATVTGVRDDGTTAPLGFTVLGTVTAASRSAAGAAQLNLGALPVDVTALRSIGLAAAR